MSRFGKTVPPTDKILELPNGRRTKYSIRDGVLTTVQDTVTEYHNRLVEFIRLYERGVDIELLVEHAGGLDSAYEDYYKKGLRKRRHVKIQPWIKKYFADIDDLEKQYHEIKQSLGI